MCIWGVRPLRVASHPDWSKQGIWHQYGSKWRLLALFIHSFNQCHVQMEREQLHARVINSKQSNLIFKTSAEECLWNYIIDSTVLHENKNIWHSEQQLRKWFSMSENTEIAYKVKNILHSWIYCLQYRTFAKEKARSKIRLVCKNVSVGDMFVCCCYFIFLLWHVFIFGDLICRTLCTDIHVPQRVNHSDSDDPLPFPTQSYVYICHFKGSLSLIFVWIAKKCG